MNTTDVKAIGDQLTNAKYKIDRLILKLIEETSEHSPDQAALLMAKMAEVTAQMSVVDKLVVEIADRQYEEDVQKRGDIRSRLTDILNRLHDAGEEYTQTQIARDLGVTPQRISRLMNDTRFMARIRPMKTKAVA